MYVNHKLERKYFIEFERGGYRVNFFYEGKKVGVISEIVELENVLHIRGFLEYDQDNLLKRQKMFGFPYAKSEDFPQKKFYELAKKKS